MMLLMLLNLSDLSSEPLHAQIFRQVRAKILSGDLAADSDLPSIRGLARETKVSVITVQRAYEDLEREGLIQARRGKGFFVMPLAKKEKRAMALEKLQSDLLPLLATAQAEGLTEDEIRRTVEAILKEGVKV